MPGRPNALAVLILFYVVVPIIGIYYLALAINTQSIVFAIATVMYACLFTFLGSRKVDYGSKILNTIRIEEAPIHITELLSETTSRGVLINQLIIKTLAGKRGISQTDLHRELPIPPETSLTKERVRQYALGLESEGIIRDISSEVGEGKKRVYVLTKRGEWCLSAIRKYYPTYYVSFLIRDVLRTRLRNKLPPFDSVNEV